MGLVQITHKYLAKMYCKLNRMDPVTETMNMIVDAIGRKACSREWNRESMSDEQFERFWNSSDNLYADENGNVPSGEMLSQTLEKLRSKH